MPHERRKKALSGEHYVDIIIKIKCQIVTGEITGIFGDDILYFRVINCIL